MRQGGLFLMPLFWSLSIINFIAFIIADTQAYQARHINVEFQESIHVALAMGRML